jgi:mono/diheme cytochrome c family protein/ribosomal protein L37AE/L43A
MKKYVRNRILKISLILVLFTLAMAGCSTAEPTDAPEEAPPPPTEAPEEAEEPAAPEEPILEGDPVRGGLLYDTWWVVIATGEEEEHEHEEEAEHVDTSEAPDTDHPLWATQTTNERSGADTWRCKECHGWDYKGADGAYGSGSHFTGFPGVFDSRDKAPADILAAMQGGTNPDHDFSTVMAEQDLIDLSLFLSQALIDDAELVDADAASTGDTDEGAILYGDVCIACHGPMGNAINFGGIDEPEFLGHLAPDNPWEFIHKVRFGQPGWPMPSSISNGWSDDDVANVLAYAQTFSAEPALSGGGQLYDSWWVVLGLETPEEDQPLWAMQSTNERSGADTWRCKECHGWDYKGADGAYGSGSHMTGFTGVLDSSSMSADDLLAWLNGTTNPDHDFSIMDEAGLNAVVAFLQQETTDISGFVNDDMSVIGDPANGKEMFDGTCAACHGVDGKKINFGDSEDPEYLGTVAADNPWEFFHKASFGQPGAPMPAGLALGWSTEEIADLAAFAQTLPTE